MNKILLIIVFLIIGKSYSQTPIGALTYGTVNNPEFIVFDERLPRSTDAQAILQANLQLNTNAQYTLTQEITDKLGRRHEKYQQYYKGVKVNSGIYNVHYNLDGTIGAINGNYYPVDSFNITPSISTAEALNEALLTVGAKEYAWQNPQMEQWIRTANKDSAATFFPIGELLVYPIKDTSDSITYQLVYQYNIVASQPFNSEIVIINALTGSILNQYTTFSSAFGDACTRYSGTVAIETDIDVFTNKYMLHDVTRGTGIITRQVVGLQTNPTNNIEIEDADNDWTCTEFGVGFDNVALDAHWAAEMTYDYFKQVHNRDSYDGQGSVLNMYVHFQNFSGPIAGEWLGTSQPGAGIFGIALGDGDGTSYDPLVSLDIVAHEFGHGVTQTSSNLLPDGNTESPSINEGLSDIWGAVVENWVLTNPSIGFIDPQGDKDPWLLGEEVRLDVVAERSMRNPKGNGLQDPLSSPIGIPMADTYGGTNFGGLRGRSGVISHWFYLLSEGSAATDGVNDNGDSFTITGIGIDKAADIVYLAQTVYFTELTDYKDVRQATLQAAKDLYGSCSLEAQTVTAAWDAVGVPVFSLYNLPSFGACGEVNSLGVPTGIYDGSGFANIVVATPADGGVVFSGSSFCSNTVTVQNGASAVFKASDKVLLEPGFKAERGANFKAYIFECVGGGNYRMQQPNGNQPEEENEMMRMITENPISIYPNPNSGQFTMVSVNTDSESWIEIYNIMGEKIFSEKVSYKSTEIDISNQPKGIYLVKVFSGNQVNTQKLIYQ